jgi:ABC-2 type transport system permease protein
MWQSKTRQLRTLFAKSSSGEVSLARLLRVYRALLRAEIAEALEYRAQIVLWIVSFIFPLVMLAAWLAIISEVQQVAGWDETDFQSYYVAMMLVTHLTGSWALWIWDEDIRTGKLSTKLLKPLDPFHYVISNQFGWKIIVLLVIAPIVLAVIWLSPTIHYPKVDERLAAVMASLVLGFFLQTFMACAFAMLGFWSTQVRNLYQLFFGVGQFLSGFIAPLAMFPAELRAAAWLLPYRSTLGFPIEILMGHLTWPEIEFGFVVAFFWLCLFLLVYRVLWHIGLRRYEAVGS